MFSNIGKELEEALSEFEASREWSNYRDYEKREAAFIAGVDFVMSLIEKRKKENKGDFSAWWEEWGDIVMGWDSYSIASTAYSCGIEDS